MKSQTEQAGPMWETRRLGRKDGGKAQASLGSARVFSGVIRRHEMNGPECRRTQDGGEPSSALVALRRLRGTLFFFFFIPPPLGLINAGGPFLFIEFSAIIISHLYSHQPALMGPSQRFRARDAVMAVLLARPRARQDGNKQLRNTAANIWSGLSMMTAGPLAPLFATQ